MKRFAVVALVVGCVALAPANATAEPIAFSVDDAAPARTADDEGGWTVPLGFTNLTDGRITLEARATSEPSCELSLDKPGIDRGRHQTMELTIPAGCAVPEEKAFAFDVTTTSGADPPATLRLRAVPETEGEEPEWATLLAFPIALGAMALLAIGVFAYWWRGNPPKRKPNTPLTELDPAWSFKDSWVTNVTATAGVLTAVFGSTEVATALLGSDAENAISLATVGAAIALGFVASGPVALAASRRISDDALPVWGLLIGAAITLAGGVGELLVLHSTALELDLDGYEGWVGIAALAAVALLVVYAVKSLTGLLIQNASEDAEDGRADPASDAVEAATMIVEALAALPGVDREELRRVLAKHAVREAGPASARAIIERLDAAPNVATEDVVAALPATAPARPRRRARSAVL